MMKRIKFFGAICAGLVLAEIVHATCSVGGLVAPTPDVTGFVATSDTNGTVIDTKPLVPRNANKSYSVENPDSQTVRFELRSGDQWVGDAGTTKERTLLDGSPTHYAPGTPITVAYNVTFATGNSSTASWFDVVQFHNDDGALGASTSPPFEMDLCQAKSAGGCGGSAGGDYMNIDIGWLTANTPNPANPAIIENTTANGIGLSYGYVFYDTQPIARGHTYAMLIQAKFDPTAGYLMVWRDNVQIVNYAGPLGFGFNTYWGMCLYRAQTTNDVQVMTVNNWAISP